MKLEIWELSVVFTLDTNNTKKKKNLFESEVSF